MYHVIPAGKFGGRGRDLNAHTIQKSGERRWPHEGFVFTYALFPSRTGLLLVFCVKVAAAAFAAAFHARLRFLLETSLKIMAH